MKMNNFKYSLNLTFSNINTRDRLSKELDKLGYNKWYHISENSAKNMVIGSSPREPETFDNEYAYLTISVSPRDFTFNIDNKWEYEAALAIAAIRDDDKPHVGEMTRHTNRHANCYKEGNLHFAKIIKVCENNEYFNTELCPKGNWESSFKTRQKATPEEIIQFMKEKYKVSELPEKWCVACPVKQKDLVDFLSKKGCGNTTSEDGYIVYSDAGYSMWLPYKTLNNTEYTEITHEQWKQWYDNQQTKTDIKETNMKPENWSVNTRNSKEAKEVVGYALSIGALNPSCCVGQEAPTYYSVYNNTLRCSDNKNYCIHYQTIEEWRKVFKPETTNMKKEQISFAIEGPINVYPDLFKWFKTKKRFDNSSNIYYGGDAKCKYFYDVDIDRTGAVQGLYGKEYKTISYQEWKEMYGTEDRKLIGVKLIKEYYNSAKLGTIDTAGMYEKVKWPEFYEGVYEEVKKEITIRVECDEPFTVTLEKGWDSIKMPERVCDIKEFKRLRENIKLIDKFNNWKLSVNTVNIGCKKNIPFKYLDEIITAWEEINGK